MNGLNPKESAKNCAENLVDLKCIQHVARLAN
jgi:hypothetical protein